MNNNPKINRLLDLIGIGDFDLVKMLLNNDEQLKKDFYKRANLFQSNSKEEITFETLKDKLTKISRPHHYFLHENTEEGVENAKYLESKHSMNHAFQDLKEPIANLHLIHPNIEYYDLDFDAELFPDFSKFKKLQGLNILKKGLAKKIVPTLKSDTLEWIRMDYEICIPNLSDLPNLKRIFMKPEFMNYDFVSEFKKKGIKFLNN